MTLVVEIKELKTLFDLVIQKLQRENVEQMDISEDYYWEISAQDWDVKNPNPELVVGSLIDDWQSLQKCLERKEVLSYVEFDRLSSVLRAISERMSNPKYE